MAFCLSVGNANAKYCNSSGSKVGAGKFCDNLVEKSCPAGCYCTGGGNISWVIGDVGKGCSGRWSKMSELSGKGVYLCPSPFTKSDGGISASSSCYYTNSSGTKLYNKNYSCGAGKYLPANSITCTTCPENYYCPGITAKPSGSDAGKTACASGTQSELGAKAASDCKKYVSCSAGQYLPANSETCAACTSGYYCTAGTYTKKAENQGLKVCGDGQEPNADKTGCEKKKPESVTCDTGKYLPANAYECSACLANSACAGGTYKPSNANQGIESCAVGYSANSDKTSCVKDKPTSVKCDPGKYLPAGKEECAQCTSGFVCSGGDLPYSETSDSGITKCPSGKVPTSDQTKCENAPPETVKCAAKQYLPANKDKCAPCLERHTCPGGDYVPSNKDQGITKSAEIALNWDRMLYGLKGADAPLKEQCWIITNPQKYIDCVTGVVKVNTYQSIASLLSGGKNNKKTPPTAEEIAEAERLRQEALDKYHEENQATLCVEVKLDCSEFGCSGGTSVIYRKKYTVETYSDSDCTKRITSISLPTKLNATFVNVQPYIDGTTCISSNGNIVDDNTRSPCKPLENTTWIYVWSCKEGYTNNGVNKNPCVAK